MEATKKELVDQIVSLKLSGKRNKYIAEKTGVNYNTVKTVLAKHIPPKKKSTQEIYKKIEFDRTKMGVKEVALKYGYSVHHINFITVNSKLKPLFIYDHPRAKKDPEKDDNKESKTKRVSLSNLREQKASTKADKSVMKTLVREERPVNIFDLKNTIVYVKVSDTRTDEQIKIDYLKNQERKLKNEIKQKLN